MLMFNENLIDTHQNEDVKTYIEKNIVDIKNVNDFNNSEPLRKYEKFFIKFDEIHQNLNKWKNLSQLTLNLHNEFEAYKDLPYLIMGVDNCTLINKFYQNNSTAIIRPNESNVTEVLYQYFLWSFVAKYFGSMKDFQIHFGNKMKLECLKCVSCEKEVDISELECSACGEIVINTLKANLGAKPDGEPLQDKLENNINNNEHKKILHDNEKPDIKPFTGNNHSSLKKNINISHQLSRIIPNYCSYCDFPIETNDGNLCNLCLASTKNMLTKSHINNNNNNAKSNGKIENNENGNNQKKEILPENEKLNVKSFFDEKVNNDDNSNNQQKEILDKIDKEKENSNFGNSKPDYKILIENKDKWLCDLCKCVNSFHHSSCQACSNCSKDKCLWICSYCDYINHINISICSVCDKTNKDVEKFLMWKCWKPFCEELNDQKLKFCKKCHLQRDPPKFLSDIVQRQINGKINKIWICNECWQYNFENYPNCIKKGCGKRRFDGIDKEPKMDQIKIEIKNPPNNDDKIFLNPNQWKCEKCTLINKTSDYHCPVCQTQRKLTDPWKCWNQNCKKINDIKVIFCEACKLDRNPPDPETKLVKVYTVNGIKEIWLCSKCGKRNDKNKSKCAGTSCGGFIFYVGKSLHQNSNNEIETKSDKYQQSVDNSMFYNISNTNCQSEVNQKNLTSDLWKCKFPICKQINKNKVEFCESCGFDRYGSLDRGVLVRVKNKDKIKETWICHICFKHNDLCLTKCSGKNCTITRFELV